MSYLGSKAASGAYQAIISLMPPHHTYIETHLGSGAIMTHKPPTEKNIGIDIDAKAIKFALNNRLSTYTSNLELRNECAHQFLNNYAFNGGELVYCDPPYLQSTRTSNNRYRFEYTQQQHIELLTILKTLNAIIILSGYPSPLYNELLNHWNTYEYQVMTRGGVRTEKLWFNYEPDSCFWSAYAGRDFTHRQQIKRKAARWANNYKNMPSAERRAVLAAMLQTEYVPA